MAAPNFVSGTIWTGDCLEIMRGMNAETVDLIYLDPPFNSNTNYAAPIGSQAAGAAFKDTWTLSDIDAEWINLIEERHPAVHRVLLAAMTNSDKSYLAYMAARLLEMPRLLKPTASIYLHCDPTMSHYLKLLMDAVFGKLNFRNEIVWRRSMAAKGNTTRRLSNDHDAILCYQKSNAATWNTEAAFAPYDLNNLDEKTSRKYSLKDPGGRRYQLTALTSPAKDRPNLTYEFLGVTRVWRWTRERMQKAYEAGQVVQTAPGRVPRFKRYLDVQRGLPLGDIWTDINLINPVADERVGYPTQKPLALLDRIIRASSNEGDVVLDPFCGCATTLVAADRLQRQWVGIDLSAKAAELVVQRVEADQGLWRDITHRTDVPQRTDIGVLPRYNALENREALYGQQGGFCAGCREHFQPRHLEVDHIIARAKGGTDHLSNLQLLCANCNRVKGDRGMEYLRVKLGLAA